MKNLVQSTKFKKDLKRYKHKPKQRQALDLVLSYLEKEQPIPAKYKPHMLTGAYAGHMECHIENDLLLVWLDPNTNNIILIRFGTHAEVLGI